jgi:LysM repeat protein
MLFAAVFSAQTPSPQASAAGSGEVSGGNPSVQMLALPDSNQVRTGGVGADLIGDGYVVAQDESIANGSANTFSPRSRKRAGVYVVKEGDTVEEIAELFDVSEETIIWANDLETDAIAAGDTLTILPVSGVRHEVEKGDTLTDLAEKYNAKTSAIRAYNELSGDEELAVGAILDIPGGEMPQESPEQPANTTVQNGIVRGNQTGSATGFKKPAPGAVKTQARHGYNAIDLANSVGSPVVAAAGGTVKKAVPAGWNGGYGKFVVLVHENGTETLYAHLSSVGVSRGQWVSRGARIGRMGNSGRSTGPHLHFEVHGAPNPF